MRGKKKPEVQKTVRVAIYTRKSVENGLNQEFNTLDAQREAIEAYVASQKGEGWVALQERYDDGGFTGANMDRPAFTRLLQDVEDDRVDVVAVYKIDRLSRSLADFAQLIQFFEKHGASFISITQQFNTATSMGKLTLNILMSFAEFERQVIGERTRDKMAASRKRGMWTGGRPPLGYDVVKKKMVINEKEAAQVREIFKIYLKHGSLLAAVDELQRRGWKQKSWITQNGKAMQGGPFDKIAVHRLLKNPVNVGKVTYKGEVYAGVHEAIIDESLWDTVQHRLEAQRLNSKKGRRKGSSTLLSGLLRCGICGASFGHTSSGNGSKRYRSYACQTYLRHGASKCPGSRIPAAQIEPFIVEKIRAIGKNPKLVAKTVEAARKQIEVQKPELVDEISNLEQEKLKLAEERQNLVDALAKGGKGTSALMERLGKIEEVYEKMAANEQEAQRTLIALDGKAIDESDLQSALASFLPVWEHLFPKERARILHLLIEEISYNAKKGEVDITFWPEGVKALAAEKEEAAA